MIIQGMKKVVTTIVKTVTKVGTKSTSFMLKRASFSQKRFMVRMMNNMKSAKWWSKAARFVRKSGLVSTAGNIADSLNKSGANNWLTKGLSAFKYDARSPADYQKEYDRKTALIEGLQKKREALIKEADQIKDELNKPTLSIHNIPDIGTKINTLSLSIDQMKAGLAQVKVTQNKTNILLGGVNEDIAAHSEHISEAVLRSSESNIKVALSNAEDIKNHNMALHAENSQNIVSEINAHIDEVEEQRKEEEEERKKNDWKRKFFLNFLVIMEWILDFPGKMKILLFKIGAILTLGLIAYIGSHWNEMMKWMESGFGNFTKNLIKSIWAILAGVTAATLDVFAKLINGVDWIIEKLSLGLYESDGHNFLNDAAEGMYSHTGNVVKEVINDSAEGMGYKAPYDEVKGDKTKIQSASTQAVKSIDANNPNGNTNLDVVNFGEKASANKDKKDSGDVEKKSTVNIKKVSDFDGSDPLNLTGKNSVFYGGGMPSSAQAWSDQVAAERASREALSTTSTPSFVPNPNMTVTSSNGQKDSDNKEELKVLSKKLDLVNENVNNANTNVIKGTSKTIKAAASRPPTQVVNKTNLKVASSDINPNGI